MNQLPDCHACDRLSDFLARARLEHPGWYNRPVLPWGDPDAPLLVVGLAPGLRGANRTGRPFCGDRSGAWVYRALHGVGRAASADPLQAGGSLRGVRISNAVKCVPPANRPTGAEIRRCRELWLDAELRHPALRCIIALGGVAHRAVLDALGQARKLHPFGLGSEHQILRGTGDLTLLDSYHPSPLNPNTGIFHHPGPSRGGCLPARMPPGRTP